MSLFNGLHGEQCVLPIHVNNTERCGRSAAWARPPSAAKLCSSAPLVRHIRRRWPTTRITFRGDSHYDFSAAMEFF
ncbi:transposase [Bradyrhizobium genosp. SA-3]|uniref:transposase n=1 Tax=Bradyrhizobium genosp. SA-3 TaxID=508868 RepID=UPI001028C4E1